MTKIPNISYTTKHHLCTGCGICEGACPSKAIKIVVTHGCFQPIIDKKLCKNEKGCHRCYDSCPGIGINLIDNAQLLYPQNNINKLAGRYLKCYTGYSNEYNIRYHCASGGMVSQFIIFLLEKGYIDGAIVTAFNASAPLKVHSYIAHNKEEVLKGKSSKYAPVTLNHAIQDIKAAKGKRYIIVGVPCHIEGFRKYEQLDKHFKEKITGYFAIYCSSGRSFYLTEYVLKERKINLDKLSYFAYRDNGCLGNMVAKGEGINHEERFQDYYHPLRSIFVPHRCTMCFDHYGELSDISFGDIHIEPYLQDKIGINSLIVRNSHMLRWLHEAKDAGIISLDEISIDIVNKSQPMAFVKKNRNAAFIRINKILKMKVPNNSYQITNKIYFKWIISYLHTNLQQFIGKRKNLWFLIPLIKGKSPIV